MLETRFIQLARSAGTPTPTRQHEVTAHGRHVATVDVAWPELGVFAELDGELHKDQPVHDAARETAVVAATGWLCCRFTWTAVVLNPTPTKRRLLEVLAQARRRPILMTPA